MLCPLYALLLLTYLAVGAFLYAALAYTGEVKDTALNAILMILFFPLYIAYTFLKETLND